jgi:hypothetical protein
MYIAAGAQSSIGSAPDAWPPQSSGVTAWVPRVSKHRSRHAPVRDRQQRRTAGPESEGGHKKAIDGNPPCSPIRNDWWNRARAEHRSRRGAGPARVCGSSRKHCVDKGTRGRINYRCCERLVVNTRTSVPFRTKIALYSNAAHESRNRAVSVSRPTAPCFLAGFALDSWSICRCKALSEGQLILPAEIRQRDRIEPGSCHR